MSDIFDEVEEEVRREKLRAFWAKYSVLVYGLAIAIVLGVAGWRGTEWWQERQAQAAGTRFEAALRLAAEGKAAEADSALAALEAEAPAGYRLLSRFTRAGTLAASDTAAAVAEFDAIAKDGAAPPLLRDLAQIRAGLILVDTAPYAELKARLEPLAAPASAFRHSARELLALSAWRTGDRGAAQEWVEAIAGDAATPSGLRARIDILRDLLASPQGAAAPAKTN